jgi:hypothetical protein
MPRESHVGKDHDGHGGLVCVDIDMDSSLDLMRHGKMCLQPQDKV